MHIRIHTDTHTRAPTHAHTHAHINMHTYAQAHTYRNAQTHTDAREEKLIGARVTNDVLQKLMQLSYTQDPLLKMEEERKKKDRDIASLRHEHDERIHVLNQMHAKQQEEVLQELDTCRQELSLCKEQEAALRAEKDAWESCRYKPLERLLDEQRKACTLLRDANTALVERFADEESRRGHAESKLWETERVLEDVKAVCENKKKEMDILRRKKEAVEREARLLKVCSNIYIYICVCVCVCMYVYIYIYIHIYICMYSMLLC
jgi:hypothetical protein